MISQNEIEKKNPKNGRFFGNWEKPILGTIKNGITVIFSDFISSDSEPTAILSDLISNDVSELELTVILSDFI
jgi:hypothetical protein